MICSSNTGAPICPCGQPAFPTVIFNPPGLTTISYRVGDFTNFREAMFVPLPGETALSQTNGTTVTPIWRPGVQGDLAVQLIEWWAYLADVLTFYNERVANESYLATTTLPESVNRLVQLLGYRPRPGIGATGILGALANSVSPFTLPKGFQIQSKPGPGAQPQVFELQNDVTITPPIGPSGTNAAQGTVSLTASPVSTTVQTGADGTTTLIALAGTSSAVKVGDRVLLLQNPSPVNPVTGFVVTTALSVTPGKDPLGNPYTNIGFTPSAALKSITDVRQYHLLTSNQSSQLWQYPAENGAVMNLSTTTVPATLTIDLSSIVRGLNTNGVIVFEGPDSFLPWCTNLASSTEAVWYANPASYNPPQSDLSGVDPSVPPNLPYTVPVAIPHTRLILNLAASDQTSTSTDTLTDTFATRPSYLVRYGWKDVGALIVVPSATVGAVPSTSGGGQTSPLLTLTPSAGSAVSSSAPVLVEDANGNGAVGAVNTTGVQIDSTVLVPPLRALVNLLPVSRGKTVANEVLGNGNAMVASQDFVLQNSPVTYLLDPNSLSGNGYSSTVSVSVNQVAWTEVPTFYNQPAGAKVFMTYEDEQGQTHVVFGSPLPTGVNNVVASYRYGSGAAVPSAGSLTVVLQPMPGLQAIRNPVPPSGGSDPDSPSQARQSAPRSVLTLGVAVSIDDFVAIASQAAGGAQATAGVAFDPVTQRPRVTVWVEGGPGAVSAAQSALAAAADPNRLPMVMQATQREITLALTIVYEPGVDTQVLTAAVQSALLDPDDGLLGVNVVNIGQVFFDSQIYAACMNVPGVTAVHSLSFSASGAAKTPALVCGSQCHNPGQDSYWFLPESNLTLTVEAAS